MTADEANASNLSSLSIFQATQEQVLESRKQTFSEWHKGMPLEQYLFRDTFLETKEHASKGKLVTWVLAPRDDPHTLDFMSSCETFERKGIFKHACRDTCESVVCYGIASVFTPAHKRGKGYARRLMSLLHWLLAPEGALIGFPERWGHPPVRPSGFGGGLFSVLYSDVGARFYAHCGTGEGTEDGWKVLDPVSTIWSVGDAKSNIKDTTTDSGTHNDNLEHGGLADNQNGYDWIELDLAAARQVWEADARLITQEIPSQAFSHSFKSSSHLLGHHIVAFLPNGGVAQTMCLRTFDFSAGVYQEPVPPWSTWGVRLVAEDGAPESQQTFATWTLDIGVTPSTLIITRLRATKDTIVPLLKRVSQFAKSQTLERVEVWNLDRDFLNLVEENFRTETFVRDDHLSALKWYGDKDGKDVVWRYNEKFAWC